MQQSVILKIKNEKDKDLPVYEDGMFGYSPTCDARYKYLLENLNVGSAFYNNIKTGRLYMDPLSSEELYKIPFYKFITQSDIWIWEET